MTNRITEDLQQLVQGCNRFAVDLYRQLGDDIDHQFFFSPYSISCALGMTLAGAKENSACEIRQLLHLNMPEDRIHGAFAELHKQTKTEGLKFNLANRIWVQDGYAFELEGVETLKELHRVGIGLVDFSQAESACHEINAWVADQTENRITELVTCLPPLTRMILTNAIYFAGYWEEEFSEFSTSELPFWYTTEESFNTSMMRQTAEFPYREDSVAQVLQMPYRQGLAPLSSPEEESWAEFKKRIDDVKQNGNQFAMQIVLPKENASLAELEGQLDEYSPITKMNSDLARVNVRLPKFHFEYGASLKEALQSLGMLDCFALAKANFRGFSRHPEGLFIGEIAHQAMIRVDERGSEAAAAIAVGGCAAMERDRPIEFRADHPFVVQIIDRRTGLIHFMGRVTRPTPAVADRTGD
ncbi:serpin family protein [Bremerella sp.]|uniref:serpin family protein n=1 Tax=Bremerella sp. TaxID=2795602 RepID=UPI00391DAD07